MHSLAVSLIDVFVRNWAMAAIVPAIVFMVALSFLILMKYVRISLNIMRTTKPPLSRNPLDFVRLIGEPVRFPAYDGLPLNGMLIRGELAGRRRGLIIFCHEFCADMHSCARYCRPLQQAGYDILTFDFRAHGQTEADADYTPRQWVSDRELSDMRGAIAFAENHLREKSQPVEIGLFGISRGACAAILAAAESPSVRAIASDGAFSTDTTIEFLMKRWAYIFATVRVVYENHPPAFWRFLRWCMMHFAKREFRCNFPSVRKGIIAMPPKPMLFIHGEKDSYLPVEQSRRLYALAAQPKYLWIAPGARHNQAAVIHADAYARLVTAFFDRHLAGDKSADATLSGPLDAAPPNSPAPDAEPVAA